MEKYTTCKFQLLEFRFSTELTHDNGLNSKKDTKPERCQYRGKGVLTDEQLLKDVFQNTYAYAGLPLDSVWGKIKYMEVGTKDKMFFSTL